MKIRILNHIMIKITKFFAKKKIVRHNYNVKTKGILHFEPDAVTKKHAKQAEWKKTAVVMLDPDISRYYAWFIQTRYNIPLALPFRGTHLTIIADRAAEITGYEEIKSKYDGTEVELEFATDVRTDGEHWWLPTKCLQAEEIRKECGLSPDPYFAFHITIGNVHERYIEHSKYIRDCIVKYGQGYL